MPIVLKAIALWFLIALVAILNGILRDLVITRWLGAGIALPMSGVILAAVVLLVSWLFMPWLNLQTAQGHLLLGVAWVLMTLAFEFLFGHYVGGKSWQEILQVFNVMRGDLFLLVLIVSLIAPWLVAQWRGLV